MLLLHIKELEPVQLTWSECQDQHPECFQVMFTDTMEENTGMVAITEDTMVVMVAIAMVVVTMVTEVIATVVTMGGIMEVTGTEVMEVTMVDMEVTEVMGH